MSVVVLKPGLLTTLQDRGRYGFAVLGVGHAGPMDDVSLRLANALVGNDENAAALELTVIGPRLRFESDAWIALTGAECAPLLDRRAFPTWRPSRVPAGSVLDIGPMRSGARACLAVAGGFSIEPTLGSAATDINARLGGLSGGRPLQAGDRLPLSAAPAERFATGTPAWALDPRPWFDADRTRPVHLLRGRHFDRLDEPSRRTLFEAEFRVNTNSNRVGYRLDGPRLALSEPLELVSEPADWGTVQLPPGGRPIVLLAEHPITGGYPRIGQIAAIDLPRVAQRRPGDTLRFREIGLDEAQTRYLRRERELARMIDTIHQRLGT